MTLSSCESERNLTTPKKKNNLILRLTDVWDLTKIKLETYKDFNKSVFASKFLKIAIAL